MTSVAKIIPLPKKAHTDIHPTVSAPCTVSSLRERRGEVDQSRSAAIPQVLAERLAGAAGFLRRRVVGDYHVDDFGYDRDLTESVFLPVLRSVYDRWFRVEIDGVEHIPDSGGALIVANHAGVVAWDALMMQVAVHDKHPRRRQVRPLAADLVFETPILSTAARKSGATMACRRNAEQLLRDGELPAVFPEGFKGCGKSFKDRYQLQRFGRGGFAAVAVRTGAPIIPCSVVGSEETYPMLADIAPVAKLFGLPYFPLTPLFPQFGALGMIPLPSKWHMTFGQPIETAGHDPETADDPLVKSEITQHVRRTIQQTLDTMLARRHSVFLG